MKKREWLILLAGLMICLLAVCGYFIGTNQSSTSGETMSQPKEHSSQFDLGYFKLALPSQYAQYIEHTRTEADGVITHVFDLAYKDTRVGLFHIIFGDAAQGEYIGLLKSENGQIPISYKVSTHAAEELSDEEVKEYYYNLMDEFNTVLSQITSIEGLEENVRVEVGTDREASLTYWNVELPEAMSWEEHHENGIYWVDFYGTVAEGKNLMYTIYLGDVQTDAILGTYQVDDVRKTVAVRSYGLEVQPGWTEQDMLTAGTLMDTVNVVIQAITSSEGYKPQ